MSDAYQVQYESNLALTELKKQVYEANARVVQRDVNGVNVAANSWGLANKYKLELWEIKNRMRVASPFVIAGMKHYHPLVSSVCTTIMNKVELLPAEDMKIVYEGTHSPTHSLTYLLTYSLTHLLQGSKWRRKTLLVKN